MITVLPIKDVIDERHHLQKSVGRLQNIVIVIFWHSSNKIFFTPYY
jgi:hypothetical protein